MYYDHATLMFLKLDRWRDDHPDGPDGGAAPGPRCAPTRQISWLAEVLRWLSRPRHLRT